MISLARIGYDRGSNAVASCARDFRHRDTSSPASGCKLPTRRRGRPGPCSSESRSIKSHARQLAAVYPDVDARTFAQFLLSVPKCGARCERQMLLLTNGDATTSAIRKRSANVPRKQTRDAATLFTFLIAGHGTVDNIRRLYSHWRTARSRKSSRAPPFRWPSCRSCGRE